MLVFNCLVFKCLIVYCLTCREKKNSRNCEDKKKEQQCFCQNAWFPIVKNQDLLKSKK